MFHHDLTPKPTFVNSVNLHKPEMLEMTKKKKKSQSCFHNMKQSGNSLYMKGFISPAAVNWFSGVPKE